MTRLSAFAAVCVLSVIAAHVIGDACGLKTENRQPMSPGTMLPCAQQRQHECSQTSRSCLQESAGFAALRLSAAQPERAKRSREAESGALPGSKLPRVELATEADSKGLAESLQDVCLQLNAMLDLLSDLQPEDPCQLDVDHLFGQLRGRLNATLEPAALALKSVGLPQI